MTVAFMVTIVGLLVSSTGEPATASSSAQLTQLNVKGLIEQDDIGRLTAIDYIVSRALDEQPLAISLNELCLSQAFFIAMYLQGTYSNHYAPAFWRPWNQDAGNCRLEPHVPDVQYGNQVLMRHTFSSSGTHYYSQTDTGTNGAVVWRNATCMTTTAFLNAFHACSTHFTLGSPYPGQENDFAFLVAFDSSRYRFGLGDLNGNRHLLPAAYQTAWWEADHNVSKRSTSDGGSPIDYVYAVRDHTASGQNATITPLGFSDHHTVRGWFWLD